MRRDEAVKGAKARARRTAWRTRRGIGRFRWFHVPMWGRFRSPLHLARTLGFRFLTTLDTFWAFFSYLQIEDVNKKPGGRKHRSHYLNITIRTLSLPVSTFAPSSPLLHLALTSVLVTTWMRKSPDHTVTIETQIRDWPLEALRDTICHKSNDNHATGWRRHTLDLFSPAVFSHWVPPCHSSWQFHNSLYSGGIPSYRGLNTGMLPGAEFQSRHRHTHSNLCFCWNKRSCGVCSPSSSRALGNDSPRLGPRQLGKVRHFVKIRANTEA